MTQHTRSSTSHVPDNHSTGVSSRWMRPAVSALVAGVGALCLAASPAAAARSSCPSEESQEDGFFIRVVAKGEGVARGESRRAAETDLASRVTFLADALGMEHSQTIVVGITDVTSRPGEGDDVITVTATSWLFVNESEMTLTSIPHACQGPATNGILQEYDMEKYDQ